MSSIKVMFLGWPGYEKHPKSTLSLADRMGRLRIEIARGLECLGFLSCFREQLRETPKLTITQYKYDVRACLEVQHSVSQAAVVTLPDAMKCF